ncbi:FtsK/SpoIIIE domain-containing protein [Modestobacter sp. VKM Ac-2986]|uniref:FtsK/SpoIIIE domain-containing protein n=1 Tax=Modestobacter sp. VKM Ac-2986 TaxID=3004140 RepID=UPI0022ABAF73|nr:FtsK/SpoIIIE domain-containing protein [Modestobacter sp. VKM Ac-2986]MCZ2829691.1 FtsK/SpoIIIE domain-containing protein [Modestobacter sp. VKM Ac-2986]
MTPGDRDPAVRTWTLHTLEGAVDVDVRAPDDAVLGDVLGPLGAQLGTPGTALWSGSGALSADTLLTAASLRHGAVLGLGRPGPRPGPTAGSGALELHVVGGPDAGRAVPLGQGDLVLGRGAGCALPLADPDVSRRHAVISVAEGRVGVADLGSSNGSWLTAGPGAPVRLGAEPHEWPVGATVRIGASTLRLTGPRGATLQCAPATGGRVLVRPLRATPVAPGTGSVRRPAPPAEAPRRRLGWVAVLLPAVGGVLMAWLLSAPHFLFFALLSPVVAVATWSSDRLSGRRSRRRDVAGHAAALARADAELDAAVAADLAARNEAAPDPARLAAAARRRSSPLWSRAGAETLPARLGTGPGPTGVTRVEPDGTRTPARAEHLPVTVPLGTTGGLGVVGPRPVVLAAARALVCQLTVLYPPADLRIVLACGPRQLPDWRWARWLPHLASVGTDGAPLPAELLTPGGDGGPRTLVVLDGPVDQRTVSALAAAPDVLRVDLADAEAGLALPALARLQVAGETGTSGRLRVPGADGERSLTLDGLGEDTADRLARDLATLTGPARTGGLPDTARLLDLPSGGLTVDPATDLATGAWSRARDRLTAVLGATDQGPLAVDLVSDGPHALVAGTTGSGKSELLQTLVAGLALHHPPDRCSLLLVDYKGGAAFGEAAALPHTVGVLTDLDPQSTARALRSLAAELTRRERLLAEHGTRDLAQLPAEVPAGRLVIVVDEFATLAEELPGFVTGLVSIAQRGRSLGVHLVLATQRPAGVVSPEIRANCSLRICLRTTDEADARDVLGSTLPATLSPDRPGRAYLRTGSAAPVLLQVARVSTGPDADAPAVSVTRRPWPAAPLPHRSPDAVTGRTDLQRLVRAVGDRARAAGIGSPDRPWLPPLPDHLPAVALDPATAGASATVLRIGLQDSPDAQSQPPLELDLGAGGGWLLVGGPRSGRSTALRTVVGEGVRQLPPARLQVHALDHGGGAVAALVAGLPHAGTTVGRDDAHRSLRLVSRLVAEVDRRRAGTGDGDPLLLLVVDGWESLTAQLEEADPAAGAGGLLRLVREGAAVGLTVVLTAERAVPGSRLAAAVRSRLVLPLPDRADYAVAGVAARAVPGHRPPGRALLGEDAVECQLALPRLPLQPRSGPAAPVPAVRVVQLPADPELPLPAATADDPAGLTLLLGPGGDDGTPVELDVSRTGGLLVVGPPGSGRSATLRALGRHLRALGVPVAELVHPPASSQDELSRTDAAGLRAWVAAQDGRRAVVLADDLTGLPDEVADVLGAAGNRLLVLATGTAAELAASFRGPVAGLRRSRTALLLRPAPGDAELLGLRVPRTPLPSRPGSGWLVDARGATRVQVARHRTGPAR